MDPLFSWLSVIGLFFSSVALGGTLFGRPTQEPRTPKLLAQFSLALLCASQLMRLPPSYIAIVDCFVFATAIWYMVAMRRERASRARS
jgi:hypothetical protein